MKSVFYRLETYGVNLREVMARFINDEDFYLGCLEDFLKAPGLAPVGDALSRESLREAFEYAHALKGVSGNLGLTPLYEASCVLSDLLRPYAKGASEKNNNSNYNNDGSIGADLRMQLWRAYEQACAALEALMSAVENQ